MHDSSQNARRISEKTLRALDPMVVGSYLERQGFVLRTLKTGVGKIYENKAGTVLVVPIVKDSRDYSRMIADLMDCLVDADTTLDDVLGMIVSPESDIVRYQIETPDATWGQLRLRYMQEAMRALYDFLMYSAAGVSTQRTEYRNVSEPAKRYIHECRFGQTELGSFVLKVFCPTNPLNLMTVDREEPFGRVVTRAALDNLEFLNSERSEDPSEPLPPAMNRQVAVAVQRLKPDSSFVRSTVKVRYTPIASTLDTPDILPVVTKLDLGPFIYGRAESVCSRLKKAEEFQREVFDGYITDLHKDRPTAGDNPLHQITIDVKYGSSRRKITMRLLPPDYRRAVVWHDESTHVRLDAVIDKRGRMWSVANLFSLAPVGQDSSAGRLFE